MKCINKRASDLTVLCDENREVKLEVLDWTWQMGRRQVMK